MNVDNENECINVICHCLCFHQLSCVAEYGSTFFCYSQFHQMNDDVQSHCGRFVSGGEDGGEGVRREQFPHERGEDGGDDDGEDDNDDGVAREWFGWSNDDNDDGVVHEWFAWVDDDDGDGGEGGSGGGDSDDGRGADADAGSDGDDGGDGVGERESDDDDGDDGGGDRGGDGGGDCSGGCPIRLLNAKIESIIP